MGANFGGRILIVLLVLWLVAPVACGQEKKAIENDRLLAVAVSADGRLLAGAGFAKDIKVWDARTGKLVQVLAGPRRTTRRAIAFAPDGQTLAGSGDDGILHLWNVRTGALERSFSVSADFTHIGALAFSPDGTGLAVPSIKIQFATTPDGNRRALASGRQSEVVVLNVNTGGPRWIWARGGSVSRIAFAPDGKTLAAADGAVHLLDGETGAVKAVLQAEQGKVLAVAYSQDGKVVAGAGSAGKSGAVFLWETATSKLLRRLTEPNAWAGALAIAPTGAVLATGSSGPDVSEGGYGWVSSEIRFWEPTTGRLLRTLRGGSAGVTSLAFLPDGRALLSCDGDAVTLTETFTGLHRLTLVQYNRRPNVGAAAPPGAATPREDVDPWGDLASTDGTRAYRAMGELTGTPRDTALFLSKHLQPIENVPAAKVNQLITNLGSDQYAVRVRAERELETLQDLAEEALVKTLADGPPLEVRQRTERLLEKLDLLKSPGRLRALRAIEVLEQLGTPEAQQVLQRLAEGAPAAQQTREARASLQRLARSDPAKR